MEDNQNIECQQNMPEQLWTVEYSCFSYRGIALVRANTPDEAKKLFLNGSNFNGNSGTLKVLSITKLNTETQKGVIFEYYYNTVSTIRYDS